MATRIAARRVFQRRFSSSSGKVLSKEKKLQKTFTSRYPLELRKQKSTKDKLKKSSEQGSNSFDKGKVITVELEECNTDDHDKNLDHEDAEDMEIDQVSQNLTTNLSSDDGSSAAKFDEKPSAPKPVVVQENSDLPEHMWPLLKAGAGTGTEREVAVIANLSARVGSIGDNHLGGWHSYRASKTALNQLTKIASVEFARKRDPIICILLHPGTVDTDLSKPIQRNVPEGKFFTKEFSVRKLLSIINGSKSCQNGKFFTWDGQEIPWRFGYVIDITDIH